MNQKDAYYFSHDSNARNDQRLMKIRMQYGMEGYGIYFGIIEILREQYQYTLYIGDIKAISFDLRVDLEKIEDIILNYNLFKVEGDLFYSKSLKKRMEKLDEKRRIRSEAGKKGGKATAKKNQKSSNATSLKKRKENKRKENKGKDINERYDIFSNQSKEHILLYDEDTVNDFISYWTEPNKSNTKMKFEMQQTFDIKRRLATWSRNDFGNKSNGVKKKINFKMPDGRNYYAFCSKCNKGEFYDPYNFNPEVIESKCCNSKIIAERNKEIA